MNVSATRASSTRASAGAGKETARARPKKAAARAAAAPVDPEERCRMIATAAYFRAERRGFVGGSALQDWLDAEAEIDRMLAGSRAAGGKTRARRAARG